MSTIFIIFGFLIMVYAGYITSQISNAVEFNEKTFIASSGIGFFSIGIALFSIGMGFFSIGTAKESDVKMKSVANANFLQIITQIEDARINFIGKIWGKELYVWRTRSLLETAYELLKRDEKKKLIEKQHKKRLVDYFNTSFEELLKEFTWTQLEEKQRKNIVIAYALIKDEYHKEGIEDLNEIKKTYLKENSKDFDERVKIKLDAMEKER